MAELKTKPTSDDVMQYLDRIDTSQKKKDCIKLLHLFSDITHEKACLWGNSIIGFGSYHYKSERSTQEGNWPLTGFSPRKQNITIYIMPGFLDYQEILKKLGKFKVSNGSCLYIKQLSDIDLEVLMELVSISVRDMKRKYLSYS